MAMSVGEVREWLETVSKDAEVAVDDGGLTLVVVGNPQIYCEIGGIPEEVDND